MLVFLLLSVVTTFGHETYVDIGTGNSQEGTDRAIAAARTQFAASPGDIVTLKFGPGDYELSKGTNEHGAIDVSGIRPGRAGRLIFRGAGSNRTTLYFDPHANWLYGRDVYRVSFIGLHMAAHEYSVSQGHVAAIGPGRLVLDIEHGFPSPLDLFDANRPQNGARGEGRFLRRYTDSSLDPHLVEIDNNQIAWESAVHISANRWLFAVTPAQPSNYRVGDLVCIKSKSEGNAYWFFGGSDIVFDDVKWTQKSRGVFRGGIDKIRIANSVIDRAPAIAGQMPCLATSEGGPQIGQPDDPPSSDDVIENNRFVATGDDSIAFFNSSGVIRNNDVSDSFARGIFLYNSPNVSLVNNRILRSPIVRRDVR